MKITKKKFQMDMPDPKQSGISDMKKLSIPMSNNDNRNVTPLGNGMNRDASNTSFMGGARADSANRIVEDKHLGPAALKLKVNQPGAPGMPRPISSFQR